MLSMKKVFCAFALLALSTVGPLRVSAACGQLASCPPGEVCGGLPVDLDDGSTFVLEICVEPGSVQAPCTASSQCFGNEYGFTQCLRGYCTVVGDGPVSGGSDSGSDNPPHPAADCTFNGVSYCQASDTCVQGLCIPSSAELGCDPPCRDGAMCNLAVGVCVAGDAPPSCDVCPSGQCQPPLFPNSPVTCLSSSAPQCSPQSPCAEGSRCAGGYCFPCAPLCDAVPPSVFADLVNSGGFNASSFQGVRPPAEVLQLISNGVLAAPAGMLLQLNATVGALLNQLNFPPGRESTAASVNAGAAVNVPQVRGQSPNGRMIVGAGASFTGQAVQVDPSASLTWSLTPAPNGGVTTAEMRSFNLSAGASINIVGDASTAFRFPPNVTGTRGSSASASLQVSGAGVRMAGCTGPVPVNIAPGSNATASFVQVSSGEQWVVGGPVLGATSEVQVRGEAHFTGHVIEPLISLYAGARAFVAADGSQPIRLGEVDFNSGGSGSVLTINGSASSAGSQVYLTKLNSCPEGAVIQFNVAEGTAEAAVTEDGLTVFNYGVDSDKDSFRCGVRICDAQGGSCVEAANSNVDIDTGAFVHRRRLLSTSSASAIATFDDTTLTITKGSGGAATHGAAASLMLLIGAAVAATMGARA